MNALFEGALRNLWVMSVPAAAGGTSGFGGPLGSGNLEGVGNICRDGGAGWRLPSLSEAAGLVYAGADGGAVLAQARVAPDSTGIPGLESAALVMFPRNASGNAALSGSVISELVALSGGNPRFALARWSGSDLRATHDATGARLYCVRERSDYPDLLDPSGLRANGLAADANGAVDINLTAPPNLSPDADYGRVTLAAYRLSENGNEIAAPDVSVSYSAGAAVLAREVSRADGRVVVGFRPASGNAAAAEVVAYPQVGRTITIALNLIRAAQEVAADDVVAEAGRSVALSAAVGFFGPAYAVPVEEGYTLRNPTFTPDGAGVFDSANTIIALAESAAVGTSAQELAMAADVACPAGVFCQARQITITMTFEPVADPGQNAESAAYLDGFTVGLILPSGYENNSANAAGRVLTLAGVDGVDAESLADVSLAVDSDNAELEYAPNGDAANALNAGAYAATIAMTQTELLGTVFMRVAVEVSPRPLSADDYGLSAPPDVVTVAAGDGAVGAAVATVSLTTSATDAQVVLPEAFPSGLSISQTADTFGAVFYLASALASESVLDEVGTLTVSLTDNANYAPLERTARIRVSALAQSAALETSGRIVDGAAFSSANVANLKAGDYANATFARVGADSDSELLIDADSGVVSTDGNIAAAGRYVLVALATSPDYVGAARLEVILNVLEENTLGAADSIPEGGRVRTRLAVAGYAGSVAFFAAERSGVTLQTPASAPSGFGFGADGAGAEFEAPEGFTLFVNAGEITDEGDGVVAVFTLTAGLTGFESADVPITVTVTAVSRPVQSVLRAIYGEEFSHSPVLPSGLETGAGLSVAGVSVSGEGDGANLFAVVNGRVEQGTVAPDVGRYEVSLGMTHSDLLGTLTLVVSAEIAAAELAEGDYGLTGLTPEDEITVAAGYVGSVYAVALSDDATDGVIQLPADDAADSFELALSGDSRTAELRLTSAATGQDVSGAFTLTVVRESGGAVDGNYAPLPQTLFATVSALPEVALASASEVIPYNGAFAVNANLHDFRTALGGAYADAVFGKESGADELEVSAEGVVSSNAEIATPDTYAIVATATASAYLGTARMTFELELAAESARTVTPDEVVAAESRGTTIDAAVGFSGAAYVVPVSEGYTLQNPAFYPAGGGLFDAENTVIAVPSANPILGFGRTLTMGADAVCLTNLPCEPLRISVTVVFNPIATRTQDSESAAYLDGFAVDLILPSGYENGGAKATGRTLTLSGVNGVAADALGNVSLSVNSAGARLEYAPNGEAADALTVGGYTATIAMTQAELLGTVFMQVGVEVSARPLSADDYGLSAAPENVAVAAGAGAVGLAVATISLTTSATDAEVLLPEAFPSGLSISQTADTFGAVFYLASALASESVLDEVGTLTVSLTDNANYTPLERTARIRVSALRQAAALEFSARSTDGKPHSAEKFANLRTGDYANATFTRANESDAGLTIDGATGDVSADNLVAGTYMLVALATSPDYVGTARLTVLLNVLEANTLDPADSVPESGRVRTRLAVAGYAGSVAFFAGARSGVVLQTPASAPVGFGFGTDGAGAEFTSPEGFTLFVNAGEIADEGDGVVAAFTLTAGLTGFESADVPITVTVTAVSRPVQPVLRVTYGEEFSHSPALPVGLETGAGLSVAGVSVSGEGDGANLFAVANGRVEQGAEVPDAGSYEVSLAVTHSDLLGTLTLVVSAEIATAELAEGDYGLAGLTPERGIRVAAGRSLGGSVEGGYVGSVYAVALSDDATDGIIQLPADDAADSFELALSADSRTAELRLTSALTRGTNVRGAFTLAVVRQSGGAVDENYAPLPQTLFATVLALGEPAQEVSGNAPLDVNLDLRAALGVFYESANFGKESGSDELSVSEEGIVSASGLPSNEDSQIVYSVVVTATASAFLGAVRIEVVVTALAPALAQFYENEFRATGDTAELAADAHSLSAYISTPLLAEFLGTRRGLMFAGLRNDSASFLLNAASDALDADDFAAVRRMCSDGGTGWRLPNFSEVAGLLSAGGTSAQVSTFDTLPGLDSYSGGITVNFPAAAEDDAAVDAGSWAEGRIFADFPGHTGDDDINLTRLGLGNTPGHHSATAAGFLALLVCVLPSDGYVAPVDPAGVLANGAAVEEGAATITLSVPHDFAAGENYGTITLAAWRFNDSGETIAATDNALSHSVGADAVSDETTGSNGEIVLGLRPASGDSITAEIVASPAVGRTVTIFAALEKEAEPVALARFYGNDFFAVGDSAVVDADEHEFSADARAEYLGVRRGLTVVWVERATGEAFLYPALVREGNFDGLRNLCTGAGAGWRLPNLSEAVGFVDRGARDSVLLGRSGGVIRVPGMGRPQHESVTARYPAPGAGDYSPSDDDALAGVVADFVVVASEANRLAYARLRGGSGTAEEQAQLVVGSGLTSGMVCARESEGYSAPTDPAGIRVNQLTVASNGTITVTLEVSHNHPADTDYGELTLEAWRFNDNGEATPASDNHPISYAAGSAARVNEVSSSEGRLVLGLRPASGDAANLNMAVWPQIGRTITVRLTMIRNAPPPPRFGEVDAFGGWDAGDGCCDGAGERK